MGSVLFRLLAGTILGIGLVAQAYAQGGGFVFDEPETDRRPELTKTDPDAAPEGDEDRDALDDFTFGGASRVNEPKNVSDGEQTMWDFTLASPTAENYRSFLELFPEGHYSDEARAALADIQAVEDRRTALVASCDTLAGDPADPSLSDGVEGVAIDAIDADAALWTCSRARAAAPDLPRLSYNLARIAEAQGQEQGALRGYRIALRLAIERTGEPHLPAAAGILRLAPEPRNPTESMSNFLLQYAVDGAGRLRALQGRVAELEAELAVASTDVAAANSAVAALESEIELLNAREIDLLSTLDTAEVENESNTSALAEVNALKAELEEANAARAKAEAENAEVAATLAELRAEGTDQAGEIDALKAQLAEALAALAAAEVVVNGVGDDDEGD